MPVTRHEAFVELVKRMEPKKWYWLSELVKAAPSYSSYRLKRTQISAFFKVLKMQGLAENIGAAKNREPQWRVLTATFASVNAIEVEGRIYRSRYDHSYYCPYCRKWIPKLLEKIVKFPISPAGRLLCPFCVKGNHRFLPLLRTQPRGSKYRRIYNETHCQRI